MHVVNFKQDSIIGWSWAEPGYRKLKVFASKLGWDFNMLLVSSGCHGYMCNSAGRYIADFLDKIVSGIKKNAER